MEPTPFDLGQAISDHLSLIKNQGSLTPSDCKELQSHLLDSVESLQKQGLSDEESFIIARKRIGHAELLGEEYSKVNLSLTHNKLWSYLLIGFNLFYGVPSLLFTLIAAVYFMLYQEFGTSNMANSIIISLHVLLIFLLYRILKAKHYIARLLEKHLTSRPLKLIAITSIPLFLNYPLTREFKRSMPEKDLWAPIRMYDNSLTELSFNVAGICMIGFMVCLVFSLRNTDKLSLKNIFHSPSTAFLLSLGLLFEFIAASTRVLHFENMLFQSISFGSVYLLLSFLITYYNLTEKSIKYVIIASSVGFILEVGVGINADMYRGNTYYTVYFALALLTGLTIGHYLAQKRKQVLLKQA